MKKVNNLSVIRVLMVCMLFVTIGRANATPYAFSVDQTLILGNVPGFVEDNFDDGVMAPWVIDYPTAIESGGVVTLSNPGDSDSFQIGNYLITEEESEIRLEDNLGVVNGAGDFIATSRWLPIIPAHTQIYGMSTYLDSPLDVYTGAIHIGIINVGPLFGDIFDTPAGLGIFFQEDLEGIDVEYTQLFPIDADDISDSILFSTYFDDSTDLFTGSFSLDGGATFLSPFTPIYTHMNEAVFDGWGLHAISYDVQSVPEPATFLLMATGLAGFGFFARKKLL
jgi:hypothetical protein